MNTQNLRTKYRAFKGGLKKKGTVAVEEGPVVLGTEIGIGKTQWGKVVFEPKI